MKFLKVLACALAFLTPMLSADTSTDSFRVPTLSIATLLAEAVPPPVMEDSGVKFGITGGLSLPTGDLKGLDGIGTNNSTGFNIGLQVSKEINKNNEIRANLIYHKFGASDWNYGFDYYGYKINETVKNKYDNLSVGVDWLYHFNSCDEGFYTILGLSANKMSCSWNGSITASGYGENYNLAEGSGSYSDTSIGLKLGAGYAFNKNFAVEATYNTVALSKEKFGFDNASWAGVGLVYRF
jgi:hypothetical protein